MYDQLNPKFDQNLLQNEENGQFVVKDTVRMILRGFSLVLTHPCSKDYNCFRNN